jgi:hypothetical protein
VGGAPQIAPQRRRFDGMKSEAMPPGKAALHPHPELGRNVVEALLTIHKVAELLSLDERFIIDDRAGRAQAAQARLEDDSISRVSQSDVGVANPVSSQRGTPCR